MWPYGNRVVGRDALIAEAGLLELERRTDQAELQIRRAVEVGPDVDRILPEVREGERHGRDSMAQEVAPPPVLLAETKPLGSTST